MSTTLRLSLFGGFQLARESDGIELPTQKIKSLLAYLVVHRSYAQPREVLLGEFWPDVDEEKARNSLNHAVSVLKKLLGEDPADQPYLLSSLKTVQLNPASEFWMDAFEFEKLSAEGVEQKHYTLLQAAERLYCGDFMAGFYDDWCLAEQTRLRELYLRILQALMTYAAERKEFHQTLSYARKALETNPLHEAIHRQLIYCYYAMGDRIAAMRQYRECARLLKSELNLEPLPETKALMEEMEHRIHSESASRVANPTRRARTLLAEYPILAPPFVGREREFSDLLTVWKNVRDGHGQFFFIGGEGGVGKTRLAHELLNRAANDGADLLWGSCYDLENKLPYQSLVEALRRHVTRFSPKELRQIAPVWLRELSKLLPELTASVADLSINPSFLSPEQERHRLLESIAQYLAHLSQRQPVVLLLDDLQWIDEGSIQFLHFLMQRLPEMRLLVLGLYRSDEVSKQSHIQNLIRQVYRRELGQNTVLARLSAEQTNQLIKMILKLKQEFTPLNSHLYRETEGNPYFLIELLKSYLESGSLHATTSEVGWDWQEPTAQVLIPQSIHSLLEDRLIRAGKRGRRVLSLMACLRHGAGLELLKLALNKPEEILLSIIERLVQQQLLIERDGQFHFSHTILRETLAARLSAIRKRRLHQRIATALEAIHLPSLDRVASELAYHYSEAEDDGKALQYFILAGQHALSLYALHETLSHFTRAQELAKKLSGRTKEQMEIHFGLGGLYRLQGDHRQALAHCEMALTIARQLGDRVKEVDALWLLGWEHTLQGAHEEALTFLTETCTLAETMPVQRPASAIVPFSSKHLAATLALTGFNLLLQGQLEDAVRTFEEALAHSERLDSPVDKAWNLQGLGASYALQGQFKKALPLLRNSLERARELNDSQLIVFALNSLGWMHQRFLDSSYAKDLHEEALKILDSTGLGWFRADVLRNLGVDYAQSGQTDHALPLLEKALEIAEQQQSKVFVAQSLCSLAEYWLRQNKPIQARPYYEQLKNMAQHRQDEKHIWSFEGGLARVHAIKAALCMLEEKIDIAEKVFKEALQSAEPARDALLIWEIHTARAQIYLRQGEKQKARQSAQDARGVAQSLVAAVGDKALAQKFLNAPAMRDILKLVE